MIKKFRRGIRDITFIGAGLGVGMAIEGKLKPSVPVFEKFAPVVAPVGTIIGANMVLNSMKMLENVGKRRKNTPKNPFL